MLLFSQLELPLQFTWHAKPGGHVTVPWHSLLVQLIVHTLFVQPPSQMEGQVPPTGGTAYKHVPQVPLPWQ